MRIVGCLIFGILTLAGCADSAEEIKGRQNDSLNADARRIALDEFNNNEFLIRDTLLEYCADYAEEIFFLQYHLKPNVWHYYNETPCVMPPGGFPRNRPAYKLTIDSLLSLRCGSDVYIRIKKSADSLKELYPTRYEYDSIPFSTCWYNPIYIPNNDSLHADLMKMIQYPAKAKQVGISGTVYVKLEIDSSGYVRNATVRKGVRSDLDSAAVAGAMQLGRFQVEKFNGKSQAGETTIPIKFALK